MQLARRTPLQVSYIGLGPRSLGPLGVVYGTDFESRADTGKSMYYPMLLKVMLQNALVMPCRLEMASRVGEGSFK